MSTIQIFGKSKCFDTKKAERFFKERRITVQRIEVDKFGISRGELRSVCAALGGIDAVIDPKSEAASLIRYLAYESDKEENLLETPKALKTPIVRNGRRATVGYCPEIWEQWVKE
jgi:arsenate reductase-like glutaredoxin family protein